VNLKWILFFCIRAAISSCEESLLEEELQDDLHQCSKFYQQHRIYDGIKAYKCNECQVFSLVRLILFHSKECVLEKNAMDINNM
jgi:hypothetical protein